MNLLCRSLFCLWIGLTTPSFAQGPLTPTGPPGPTMKTLEQVEPRTPISALPFTITQPGSYYLTTNLVDNPTPLPRGTASGIIVATNDVTIDLNGFALIGLTNSLEGIAPSREATNVTVRNGLLRGWYKGIGLGFKHGQFLNLQVSQCRNNGIDAGDFAMVKQCSVVNCETGIRVFTASTVTDCVATGNEQGFIINNASTALGCRAANNLLEGFLAQFGATLVNCTAAYNTNGFNLGRASTAVNCSVFNSFKEGIRADSASTVRDCSLYFNPVGILASNDCRIVNNTINRSDSVGIQVTGSDNRIDGNHVTDTPTGTGILINPATGNIVFRNTCSGNGTNFNVAANNVFGPIISTSSALTNASPWANFAF